MTDRLTEYVREAWRNACDNGTAETLRAMKPDTVAAVMIAHDDRLISHAEPGKFGLDFGGLQDRVATILPQVMHA